MICTFVVSTRTHKALGGAHTILFTCRNGQ